MFENHIEKLSEELDLESPLLQDASGRYTLAFEDGVAITMHSTPSGFTFFCDVAAMPERAEIDFITDLLSANLLGQVTHHAVLGLSGDGKIITLSRTIDHRIDYHEFRDILEDFTNAAEFWRSETLSQQ